MSSSSGSALSPPPTRRNVRISRPRCSRDTCARRRHVLPRRGKKKAGVFRGSEDRRREEREKCVRVSRRRVLSLSTHIVRTKSFPEGGKKKKPRSINGRGRGGPAGTCKTGFYASIFLPFQFVHPFLPLSFRFKNISGYRIVPNERARARAVPGSIAREKVKRQLFSA